MEAGNEQKVMELFQLTETEKANLYIADSWLNQTELESLVKSHPSPVTKNTIAILETLLGYNAEINQPEKTFKTTPLHWAARLPSNHISLFLINNHAKIDIADTMGNLPLDIMNNKSPTKTPTKR
jgi:ankyrin repeat protein